MYLDAQVTSHLRQIIDKACEGQKCGIPGPRLWSSAKMGTNYSLILPVSEAGSKGNVTLDNVFWIASCTKMLIGIACMQLVEQGVLKLDDGE
jgi:hypothetical protein